MSRILVGTASWTDKSLVACGRFYPPDAKTPAARLQFYASCFPVVEVDSAYYALPSPHNAALWVERTPADFVFHIKAFRAFTQHRTPIEALPRDVREALPPTDKTDIYYKDMPAAIVDRLWEYYRAGIAPLHEAGRLGAVHFQFAPWVLYGAAALDHIEACMARLPGLRLSIEFRHRSWFTPEHRDKVLRFLADRGLVHTVVDEPQGFVNSVPAIWEVTSAELAVVRMHGRNAATWNRKGLGSSAARFNYDYSDAELAELAGKIKQLAARSHTVAAFFNNNYEDQGQRNGRTLMRILTRS
ncbi:MAG: DUF72 domain-containing protein [Burkholderiales bacterium]|nr:DUF72 domain-containing protein [Burkholderiales bacterium]